MPNQDFSELVRIPPGRHRLPRDFVARHQKQRLFAAITELVAEQGYPATSVTDIVKKACISRDTFYEHFAGKEALFLALVDATGEEVLRVAREAGEAEPGPWEAKVRAGIAALIRFVAENPKLAHVCMVEAQTAGPEAMAHYAAWLRSFARLLRFGREELAPGVPLPDSLEEIVAGGIIWMLDRRISAGRKARLDEVLAAVVEFALTPYIGSTQARRAARSGGDPGGLSTAGGRGQRV